jgi:isoprenylcysteine carboxyl methyltransferase (ICMT) family protein YpbQ
MLALLITFVALIALQRVLELLLSRRHQHALRAKGAYERDAGHYPLIVGLPAEWLVSRLSEGWVRCAELSILWPFWLSLRRSQTRRHYSVWRKNSLYLADATHVRYRRSRKVCEAERS